MNGDELRAMDNDVDRGAIDRGRETTAMGAVAPLVDDSVHDLLHVYGGLAAEFMDLVAGA